MMVVIKWIFRDIDTTLIEVSILVEDGKDNSSNKTMTTGIKKTMVKDKLLNSVYYMYHLFIQI